MKAELKQSIAGPAVWVFYPDGYDPGVPQTNLFTIAGEVRDLTRQITELVDGIDTSDVAKSPAKIIMLGNLAVRALRFLNVGMNFALVMPYDPAFGGGATPEPVDLTDIKARLDALEALEPPPIPGLDEITDEAETRLDEISGRLVSLFHKLMERGS